MHIYFGINRGNSTKLDVTQHTATPDPAPATNIELALDLSVGMDRSEVLLALDVIKARLTESDWPPA